VLDECQQLGAAAANSSTSSRLLVGLQEGVQQVTPLGAGAGVEVATSSRRYGQPPVGSCAPKANPCNPIIP
jgi:hypothetical protein